jgi:hypothetical protein
MRELEQFQPYLTGSVLNGNAGKYADINLQLYTDNGKAVEMYLIERGIPYKAGQTRLYSGGEACVVPFYTVGGRKRSHRAHGAFHARAADPDQDQPEGKAIERAKLATVQQMLDQDESDENP